MIANGGSGYFIPRRLIVIGFGRCEFFLASCCPVFGVLLPRWLVGFVAAAAAAAAAAFGETASTVVFVGRELRW